MPAYFIVIILFILGALIFGFLQRNNYLEKLPMKKCKNLMVK